MSKEISMFKGIPFEVVRPRTNDAERILRAQREGISGLNVNQIYGRPSSAKQSIARWWSERIYKAEGYNVRIPSYNCMQFTISFVCDAYINEIKSKIYFYVTKEHTKGLILTEDEIDERLKQTN